MCDAHDDVLPGSLASVNQCEWDNEKGSVTHSAASFLPVVALKPNSNGDVPYPSIERRGQD